MNSFEFNKIVGAVLATIFVLFGGSILAEGLFHSEAPETPGYEIVAAEAEAGGAEGGTAKAEDPPIAALLQTADAEAGAGQFKKCAACHTAEKGGANKVGPHLWDVVNRPIASVSDFAYSAGMTEFSQGGSVNWDFDHLDGFLKNPKGYVSGTAMGFAGLKDPEARAELIAYLRTLSDNPAPLPEAPTEEAAPAEAAAEGAAPAEATAEGAAPAETAAADPATTTQPEESTNDAEAQAPAVSDTEAAQPAPGAEAAPTQATEGEAKAPAAATPTEAAPAEAAAQPAAETAPAAAEQPVEPAAEQPAAEAAPAAEQPAQPEAAAPAAPAAAAPEQTASVAGDAEAGKGVFRKCQACHAVGENAKNKIGPELNGIVGEKVAAVEGYSFSGALTEYAAAHPTWTVEELTAWLTDPKGTVPGTKMSFPGLKKPEDVANIIAYLATFDETGAQTGN